MYVGTGVKRVDPSFNPTSPPVIDMEPTDPMEQSEPNPDKEPVEKVEEKNDDDAEAE